MMFQSKHSLNIPTVKFILAFSLNKKDEIHYDRLLNCYFNINFVHHFNLFIKHFIDNLYYLIELII